MAVDSNAALIALVDNDQTRFWRVSFDRLSPAERTFRLVWELEGEVNNGGFDQYFFNSSGDIARLAPDALRAIGAHATAQIVARALSVFGEAGPSPKRDVRIEQLEDLSDQQREVLDASDADFYRYQENLSDMLYRFVVTHRSEIVGVPAAF